jgi:hypothetical protein
MKPLATVLLLIASLALLLAQGRSETQNSIVRDGSYVGLEKMPNILPDDPHASWFHEKVVRNDEAVLDEVPVVFHGRKKNYSASDGGFLTFRARFEQRNGEPVILLRMCQSDYVAVPVPVNPHERQDRYEDIKTYSVKLNSDKIEFNGVSYKIAKVQKNELDRLVELLHAEPLEKK